MLQPYTVIEDRKPQPAPLTRSRFLQQCATIWAEHEDMARIVNEIEALMSRYNVKYLRHNITATLTSQKGTIERTARDEFSSDLFNHVDRSGDVARICDKHFNFLPSTIQL